MKRCLWCENELPTRTRTSGNPQKFCSKSCSGKFYNSLKPKNEILTVTCPVCRKDFTTNKKSHAYCSSLCRREAHIAKAVWPRRWNRQLNRFESICQICGVSICKETPFGRVVRCDSCRGKAISAINRQKNTKRRKAHAGNRITVEILAMRDGNNCYLCNEVIDLDLPRNKALGAVIDHVMPIAKGGLDTWDNVKLTHRTCNAKKSDKIIEGINA